MKILNTYEVLKSNYKINYTHSRGLRSISECLLGTFRLKIANEKKMVKDPNSIEFLTFSVLPALTSLWAWKLKNIDVLGLNSIIVGDCSGGLHNSSVINSSERFPFLNYPHGEKLDFFLKNVCSSRYVVVCDDDIIWTSQEPLNYALNKFNSNSNLAVVSLVPSNKKSFWLSEKVKTTMGSYCIIIDRHKWLSENMTFRVVKPHGWREIGYYFDTADYANLRLHELGYDINIAPKKIQKMLIKFTGLSLWGLRIQNSFGNIDKIIRPRPNEYEKVYRVSKTLCEISMLCLELDIVKQNMLINKKYLLKARNLSKKHVSNKAMQRIDNKLEDDILLLNSSVNNFL